MGNEKITMLGMWDRDQIFFKKYNLNNIYIYYRYISIYIIDTPHRVSGEACDPNSVGFTKSTLNENRVMGIYWIIYRSMDMSSYIVYYCIITAYIDESI